MDDELQIFEQPVLKEKTRPLEPTTKDVLTSYTERQEREYRQSVEEKTTGLSTMRIKSMEPVLADKKISAELEEYGTSNTPMDMSPKKREKKKRNPKSRLYAKDQAAKAIEKAQSVYHFDAESFKSFFGIENEVKSDEEALALSVFHDKFDVVNPNFKPEEDLIDDYAREETRPRALLNMINYYVNVDLDGLKMDTDMEVAQSAPRLENLVMEHKAMLDMMSCNREFYEGLDQKIKRNLHTKMQQVSDVCAFYKVRKAIITDPYYREHYNSEISRVYRMDDDVRSQRLTRLIQLANQMRTKGEYVSTAHKRMNMSYYNYRSNDHSNNGPVPLFDIANSGTKVMHSNEFSKLSNDTTSAGPHAEYLQNMVRLGTDQVEPATAEEQKLKRQFQRLIKERISIGGKVAGESLFRGMSGLASLKGVRTMARENLTSLIDKLTSEDEQAKLEGMKVLRDLLIDHVKYLQGKYGNDIEYFHYTQTKAHEQEMLDDFRNTTCTGEAFKYMLTIPELREGKYFDELMKCQAYVGNIGLYSFGVSAAWTHEDGLAPEEKSIDNFNRFYCDGLSIAFSSPINSLTKALSAQWRVDGVVNDDVGKTEWVHKSDIGMNMLMKEEMDKAQGLKQNEG